jgi:predicted nucleic acid-binding protein
MELVQGMKNKNELRTLQKTLKQWGIKTIYINEKISSRALFYMDDYFLSHSMQLVDSLIASTAISNGIKLITSNDEHYKIVKDIYIYKFLEHK